MPELLRPGFGPTLPALLRDRFGIAPRTTLIVAAAVAIAAAGAVVVATRLAAEKQLVHEGEPVFNLLYDDDVLREAEPRRGELVRLEGRRGRVTVAVTARALPVPPFDGDVAKGWLPIHAELHLDRLRARDPSLKFIAEGRSTVNESPGYQVEYRTGEQGRFTFWREIFVVPDEEAPRLGVHLAFANGRPGRVAPAASDFILTARSAFRSFRFGTERG
jgi:hypothetical protein